MVCMLCSMQNYIPHSVPIELPLLIFIICVLLKLSFTEIPVFFPHSSVIHYEIPVIISFRTREKRPTYQPFYRSIQIQLSNGYQLKPNNIHRYQIDFRCYFIVAISIWSTHLRGASLRRLKHIIRIVFRPIFFLSLCRFNLRGVDGNSSITI